MSALNIKTVPLGGVMRLLGRRSGDYQKMRALLAKHGVEPVAVGQGNGPIYMYREADVLPLVEKLGRPKPAAPAISHKLPDDDVLAEINKKLEGQSGYVCRLGDENARLRSDVAQMSAQVRSLTIGINRLLKAANLQPAPETPTVSGVPQ